MEAFILSLFVMVGLAESQESLLFTAPQWLWLMLLWPLLVVLSFWLSIEKDDIQQSQANQNLQVRHPLIHLLNFSSATSTKAALSLQGLVLQLLRGVMMVLLAIILANPVERLPLPPQPESKTVRDIAFVIESSASFLLPDYQLNGQDETRMNVVKQVLDEFIADLSGNRFSLTIYAEHAYRLLPMTYDTQLTRLSLKRLKPYLAGRTDVAMGEALGLALRQGDPNLVTTANNPQQGKKVIVLISDGLSLPSRLALTEVVNYSQLLQIPIYTIGVGAGSEKADKREFAGLIYQPLEAESLQLLAQQTQGQYFQVGSGAEIQQVLEKINQAEGVLYTPPPSEPVLRPLFFAVLGLLLATFLLYGFMLLLMNAKASPSLHNSEGES